MIVFYNLETKLKRTATHTQTHTFSGYGIFFLNSVSSVLKFNFMNKC